jgi:hypothetical protein
MSPLKFEAVYRGWRYVYCTIYVCVCVCVCIYIYCIIGNFCLQTFMCGKWGWRYFGVWLRMYTYEKKTRWYQFWHWYLQHILFPLSSLHWFSLKVNMRCWYLHITMQDWYNQFQQNAVTFHFTDSVFLVSLTVNSQRCSDTHQQHRRFRQQLTWKWQRKWMRWTAMPHEC